MKRIMKKSIALLLVAATLLVPLAGCKKDKDGNGSTASTSEYVYVPEYLSVTEELQEMYNFTQIGDYLYFVNSIEIPGEPYLMLIEGGIDAIAKYSTTGTNIATPEASVPPVEDTDAAEVDVDSAEADTDSEEKPQTLPIPEDGVIPDGYTIMDGNTYETVLARIKTDGTGYEALPGYKAPELDSDNSWHNIRSLTSDSEGNLWLLENISTYTEYDSSETFTVRKLDETGAEISSIDLSSLSSSSNENYFYINGMAVDGKGNVYILGEMTVYVFDSNNTKLFEVSSDNWMHSIINFSDGSVAVSRYGSSGYELVVIDTTAKTWGEKYPLKTYAQNMLPGNDDYDFFYSDHNNLYGYKLSEGKEDKLINWINSDIDTQGMPSVAILNDGNFACFTNEWGENADGSYYSRVNFIKLNKTPSSEVPQKIHLTLAVMYLEDTLRKSVLEFNKKSTTHRIEVSDYSEYNNYQSDNPDEWQSGVSVLNTEIISGKIPDIISASELSMQPYIAKGILEDLYPYIDNDPELSREGLISSVLNVLETDGKLYQLSPSFALITAIGNKKYVGDKPGWTTEEALAALSKAPDGATLLGPYVTRDIFFQYNCIFDMDNYIDWTTGKCSFDSEGFIELLEFANTFPKDFDYTQESQDEFELAQSGMMLTMLMQFSRFDEFQQYKAMFGDDVALIGMPTSDANGHAIVLSGGMSMSSKCKDKEAAWEFMRICMTEEYQTSSNFWSLPTNKKAFDAVIEKAMEKETYIDPVTGEEVEQSKGSWGWGENMMVEMYAVTQEEVDMFTDLLERTTKQATYDSSIIDILTAEAVPFFSGQKTAKEVAEIIQSKMNIYVNEQM